MSASPVTGVVLAAGNSRRLGTPKQLLPYGDTTLLGASLRVARSVGFDRLIVTLGAAVQAVREAVPLDGIDVVIVDDTGTGCSASLRAALDRVDPRAPGIALMLGDQPLLRRRTLRRLIAHGAGSPDDDIVVCRYDDGIGHPFWLSSSMFGEVRRLHGDKGVWKLVESGRHRVHELRAAGPVPLDVDTWADYRRLVETTSA
jgi:molybdenum cofactor cytidylyltransferase